MCYDTVILLCGHVWPITHYHVGLQRSFSFGSYCSDVAYQSQHAPVASTVATGHTIVSSII